MYISWRSKITTRVKIPNRLYCLWPRSLIYNVNTWVRPQSEAGDVGSPLNEYAKGHLHVSRVWVCPCTPGNCKCALHCLGAVQFFGKDCRIGIAGLVCCA